tara:strand:- start:98 stop:574 length:477 start_codon:yes stop_codon:yes gene_type:complete
MSAMQKANGLTLPEYKVAGEIDYYGFDDSADEGGIWRIGQLPTLAAGDMTVDIDFFASALTGDVQFNVQALAYNVGTDVTALSAATFDTAVSSTATGAFAATANVPVRVEVTLTTNDQDGAVTDDYFVLKIYRDTGATGDTLSGDAEVVAVHLSYAAS